MKLTTRNVEKSLWSKIVCQPTWGIVLGLVRQQKNDILFITDNLQLAHTQKKGTIRPYGKVHDDHTGPDGYSHEQDHFSTVASHNRAQDDATA